MTGWFAISAVLPCFEEAPNLQRVVEQLGAVLQDVAAAYEIVVVASAAARDGTPELARQLARERPDISVVIQEASDPGYGRALALGIEAARHEWLLLSDADGQFDHTELTRLAELAPGNDVVLGYRAERHDSPARVWASRLYGAFATRLTGVPGVRDVDCAFKLLRRSFVEGAPLVCRTGVVNAELLSRALARGARVAQVAVTHRERAAGRARFERRLGFLGAVPRPAEAWAMARETLDLALRRFVASSRDRWR